MRLKVFKQENIDYAVFSDVERIGNELFEHCNTDVSSKDFEIANLPGNSSAKVQDVFLDKALQLGFQSERRNLFNSISTSNLRPDYYRKIGKSGIIIEVERGKTIMNNMDMLDMWKCHLCDVANHLFLFVPSELKHNAASKPYDCFRIVSNRMEPFFESKNYTNVHSLWIFGY
jgi:hypothetical protein